MNRTHATRVHARMQSVVVFSDTEACRAAVLRTDPAKCPYLEVASKPFRALFDLEPDVSRQVAAALAPGLGDDYLAPLIRAEDLEMCKELLKRVRDSIDPTSNQRLQIELATIFGSNVK
jgi:hypothetical protein